MESSGRSFSGPWRSGSTALGPRRGLILIGVAGATIALAQGWVAGTAAPAAEYVVDRGHPQATDDGPGTEVAPWKTLAKACRTARAGDTVDVVAGDYQEPLALRNSGTADKPIVFRGVPRWQARVKGIDLKGDYIRVQDFEVTGVEGLVSGASMKGTDLELVGNYIHDIPAFAISSEPDDVASVGRIAYNRICKVGIGIYLYGDGCLIESNDISRLIRRQGGPLGDADYTRVWGRDHVLRFNHFHDTRGAESGNAHVDGLQNFAKAAPSATSTWTARNIVMEYNVCSDFAQAYDAAAYAKDVISHHTFRRNVCYRGIPGADAGGLLPAAWGICAEKNQNGFVVEHNTYADMMWFGVGLCNGSSDGIVRGNVVTGAKSKGYRADSNSENCTFEQNLYFGTGSIGATGEGCLTTDPMFVDPGKGNFRLKPGSPCIGAGPGGSTIGALEYPNVYWVDPRHPGATDDGFGYAGAPFKTLEKACAVAERGETIVLRGGVHRGLLRPPSGVTVRAAMGEKPVVSGADLVEGWKRVGDTWVTPLAAKPVRLLRDGAPLSAFTYDDEAREISVKGFDPRLDVIESVVRPHAIDLRSRTDVKIEGIETRDTLEAGTVANE